MEPVGGHAFKPRSSVRNTIAEARASLADPSRPFTPAEPGRHLFRGSGSTGFSMGGGGAGGPAGLMGDMGSSRPSSSFRISSSQFAASAGLGVGPPIRPTSHIGAAEVLSLEPQPTQQYDPPAAARAAHKPAYADGHFGGRAPNGGGPGSELDVKENAAPPMTPFSCAQQQWWGEVDALLGDLSAGAPVDALIAACDGLWDRLKPPTGLDGPGGAGLASHDALSARRSRVLTAVAQLMDRKEAPLLLRLCRLVLAVCSEGGPLIGEREGMGGAIFSRISPLSLVIYFFIIGHSLFLSLVIYLLSLVIYL